MKQIVPLKQLEEENDERESIFVLIAAIIWLIISAGILSESIPLSEDNKEYIFFATIGATPIAMIMGLCVSKIIGKIKAKIYQS